MKTRFPRFHEPRARADVRRLLARTASILLLASLGCPAAGVPGASAQTPEFSNEVVVPGITAGLTMAFTPDGRMLVGELTEKIWVIPPGGSAPLAKPFLDMDGSLLQGEQGLMDILLDPNFATNHWYYVFYTKTNPTGNHNRVSRFTASGDTTLAGSEFLLWEDPVSANLEHHGGALFFGPGGKLFITVGEQFYAEDAQLLNTYRGKLLRINPDGTIPTDNPFYDGAGPNHDEIWAYGLRNPVRASYDPVSGRIYIGDVGGNDSNTAKEEINVGVAGANYGWPLCEGVCGTPGLTDPIYAYPHNQRDAAVMGGFVYRGSAFPASYQGSYFFADYAQNWIKRLTFDGAGNLTGVFNFEPPDGSADGPYGDITKLIEGPDGSLYYVDIGFNDVHVPNEASIRRIRYLSNNQSPVAVADATPRSGPAPLSVAFSSAGSLDPEGQPITTTWTFGDNTTSTAANPTHVYSARGMYTARLQVSDGVNSTLSGAIGITAGTPPTAQITSPVNGILFRAGDLITYTGSGLDYLGNPLPPSAYSWTILFHHETHVHPSGGPFTGITTGSFTIPSTGHDFAGATNYEIVLTVTDSDGLSTSTSATIYPDKVNLSFSTQPNGLSIDVDGLRKSTPFVLDALKGFHNIINAPAQLAGGQAYDFTSWSDGGARSHEIVVPNTDSSWTATFTPTLIPDGLVAGYAFEEGAGTTTSDESGNGNDGTLAGAVWTTQGRFGNALAFTGSNSKVTVPDSPSLQLASGMTLEAWVYPTAATGAWTDVIMKWNDDYYVTASSQPNGRPACGSRLSGSLYGTSALPVNAWSHLATTYDGAFVRLYVNGLEVSNRAATGTLPASGGPLSFGGDGLFGQYFTGRIDEVRIYDHALTPSEIQSDMSVSVITAAGEPSAAPPRRSAILGAAPNPFNPATRIRFRLGTAGRARLRIFDVAGRQVRSFDLGARAAGEHSVGWDGTSGSGARVASGVYVARLEAPDGRSTLRMVLLK